MKVILELTKNDMFKMLALSEFTDEETDKIMEKFSKSEEITIDRDNLIEFNNQFPIAIACIVINEIAKELDIKL